MKTILLKYKGNYAGVNPATGLSFKPGEIKRVSIEDAEKIVESGQFEVVNTTLVRKGGE